MQFSLWRLMTAVTFCAIVIGLARGWAISQPPYRGLCQFALGLMLAAVLWVSYRNALKRQ